MSRAPALFLNLVGMCLASNEDIIWGVGMNMYKFVANEQKL
jgi:hypothetical protein